MYAWKSFHFIFLIKKLHLKDIISEKKGVNFPRNLFWVVYIKDALLFWMVYSKDVLFWMVYSKATVS